MRFDIVSLFPEMFDSLAEQGVAGRGRKRGLWSLKVWNPRDYTHDVHRTVDDRPYGGGPGMVMMVEPLEQAVHAALAERRAASTSTVGDHAPVILLSPAGAPFNQARARRLCDSQGAILVCGRYEGIDQRFIDRCVTEEISLGDFVMSGGEIAAMAIVDSTVRLLDGVLNDSRSAVQDSFNTGVTGLLDSPHYTRPEQYRGQPVPAELLSGHHANIAVWRRRQSLLITARRRPDLIEAARARGLLSRQDEQFLLDQGMGGK
jgi:tRNA (guanine37-N1)-methyltransferase